MIIEMKLVELIYIGETNERYNNLEKYWFLISNVTGSMVDVRYPYIPYVVPDESGQFMGYEVAGLGCSSSISRIEDFISISDFRDGSSISRIEDFISISDFRDGKLKDLGI